MPLMRWLRDRARPKLRRDSSIPTNTTHSFPYDDGEYHAEFETTPFSAGASRDAYRGKLVAHGKLGKHNGSCVVIKVFKAEYAARSECWAPDLRSHAIAASLARRFNREVPSSHPLYFVMPIVVRIDRAHTASYFARRRHHTGTRGALFGRAARLVGGGEFALLEPFLDGEYKKVISNNGWIADDAGRLPRAFAHWTYHVNYGRRMIVDLQGVRTEDGYKLTGASEALGALARVRTDPSSPSLCARSRDALAQLRARRDRPRRRGHGAVLRDAHVQRILQRAVAAVRGRPALEARPPECPAR